MTTPDQAEQSSERQFLENLLNTRVNFLVAVFALACAAAATLDDRLAQVAVLGGSTVIAGMLSLATSRAQFKLDLTFEELAKSHPAKATDEAAKARASKMSGIPRAIVGGSRRRLVGYWLPWTTTLFLLIGTIGVSVSWYVGARKATSALAEAQAQLEGRIAALTDSLAALKREVEASSLITRARLDSLAASLRQPAPTATKRTPP